MSIKKEQINEKLVKTYSDEGFMIRRVGTFQLYEEAIDPIDIDREYVETDILIEVTEEETTEVEGNELVN